MGYFAYFGSFFQAFVSATDYFINASLWLPAAAITLIGWINYQFIWQETPKIIWRDKGSWLLPAIIFIPTILMFIFAQEGTPLLYFVAIAYLWLLLFEFFFSSENIKNPFALTLRQIARLGVVVCLGFVTLGWESARSDSRKTTDLYQIQLKGQPTSTHLIPLRSFDKGLLVRNPIENTIYFLKWDNVESIKKIAPGITEPLGCVWFSFNCRGLGQNP